MIPDPFVVGVDGGGTKTEALLSVVGKIAGRGVAGSSNYQKVGFADATHAIEVAVAGAFQDAGIAPSQAAAICLGLSGVDRAEDQRMWANWLAAFAPEARREVVNDCELGLAAGTPDDWGLAVVCGTGSICFGRNRAGDTARADGWGYILGDDGSGYSIGLAAMRAILCEYDGRGPATTLTRRVLEYWALDDPEGLLVKVYLDEAMPAEVASLATLVAEEAEAGDATAIDILRDAGSGIARTMAAVAHRLSLRETIPCALTGGVITKSSVMYTFTLSSAAQRGLDLSPVTKVTRPAEGAVNLAQRLLRQG
jgi:N-acetylglucosamine kinase-like BadF-type ATPase